MTYDEFRRQLGKAGISLRVFSELLCMNPNSVTNLSQVGDVPDHLAVIAVLMGEMAEHHIDFRAVIGKIELSKKKPRGKPGGNFGRRG